MRRQAAQDRNGLRTRSASGRATAPHRLLTPRLEGSDYLVEVREYRCKTPLDSVYVPAEHHVEFTLSPFGWRGRYQRVSDELRPIGQVMLSVAGEPFRAVTPAGAKRSLVCAFQPAKLAAFHEIEWTPQLLDRTLDIRSPRLEALLSALMDEAFSPGVASEVMVEATVISVMVELRRYFGAEPEPQPQGSLAPWQLRLIRDRVDGGGAPRTIAELAAECGLSARQLMRAFKATSGLTLGAYMRNARVSQAKRVLSGSDLMIKQAAFECGFETPAAFAAAFRKATGMTPNAYRRLYRSTG